MPNAARVTRVEIVLFLIGIALGAVAGTLTALSVTAQRPAPSAQTPLPSPSPTAAVAPEENPYAGFRVAEFRLLDHNGVWTNQMLFDGRVTVLSFFFTSCPGPCPDMTRAMRTIQDRTAGTPLRLASISVDGARDTPAIIRAFAEAYGADLARWCFLTGNPELVRTLARESIDFELREQPDYQIAAPDGSRMANILHPTRLLLVGPDRRLIGVYAYNDPAQIDRLIADALAARP